MSRFKEYGLITLGIILVAISVEYFFAPNNIAAGGVTGLAIVLNKFIPFMNVGSITLIINALLFVAAFIFIDGNFGGKSIYASLGLSIAMWVIEGVFKPFAITQDLMLASIFGTLISALGMAIVFNKNSSTGGTDIIAKILNKFFHIDIGKSLLIVDFIITLAGIVVFGIDVGLYAMLSVIILGIAVDRFIEGFNACKSIVVMSEKNEEIAQYIMKELDKGVTFFKGEGAYCRKESMVLYTVLGRSEFIRVKTFIREVDEAAFISVSEVHEVLGEGFKDIK